MELRTKTQRQWQGSQVNFELESGLNQKEEFLQWKDAIKKSRPFQVKHIFLQPVPNRLLTSSQLSKKKMSKQY